MNTVHSWMLALGDWLSIGVVHGTALAFVTALATATVLRRARPALLAGLWTVVVLKFLVPIGPGHSWSLSTAIERSVAEPAVTSAPVPGLAAGADVGLAQSTPSSLSALAVLLAAFYVGGVIWRSSRWWRSRSRLRRRLAEIPLYKPDEAFRRLAAQQGVKRLPQVRRDPGAASPYLVGWWRARLVVPTWLDANTPTGQAALIHEFAHLRRWDPLVGAIETAVAILFWFWPPVAWIRRQLGDAREMACDAWAVEHGPLSARQMAALLVEVAGTRVGRHPDALSVALVARNSRLLRRVDRLLGDRTPARLGRGPTLAVAAWATVGLAGTAGSPSAAASAADQCEIEPALIAQILASNPDADIDGDGVLSRWEACAHQRRMTRKLIDHVVDADMVSRVDPDADIDGDGLMSVAEVDTAKSRMSVGMAERGLVLEYGTSELVAFSPDDVTVNAAISPGKVCPERGCSDVPRANYPLLIDVSPNMSLKTN